MHSAHVRWVRDKEQISCQLGNILGYKFGGNLDVQREELNQKSFSYRIKTQFKLAKANMHK